MDHTENSPSKEVIIRDFRDEIGRKLSFSLTATDDSDLNSLFLELVERIKSEKLTSNEAAEVFEELGNEINKQRQRLRIDGVEVTIDGGSRDRANYAISFRAERFFRDYYRERIESLDLPGKMEFIGERIEAFSRIPLQFGQAYIMPALEYLNDEFEREFKRLKKTKKRRALLHASKTHGTSEPDAKPTAAKVIKTRRRDIPADRIGLFFYYLFESTGSNGTREDKAKVVNRLTLFAESTIKRLLSNHLANEDEIGFNDDFKAVMRMFKMIGFSDAYDLMKRDKKRE